jgi:TolB-like protein
VAILAADVFGYSRLMAADEAGTLAHLKALRNDIIDPKLAQFGGRLVGTAGDSLLVEFASAVDAVQCAVEMQERMLSSSTKLAEDRRMIFRMGINVGDVIPEDGTIYGDGVNVAARLEKISEPGGVIVSRSVYEQVQGKLPYRLVDLGEQKMKNITGPVHAYAVAQSNRPLPTPTQINELSLPTKPSVAVLPFENMSGDRDQDYFSDGITEDIITELSRSPDLFVIARNSSFQFKGRAVDIADVGRKLGVRYVVEGSVRRAGNRIRITAQLIEAEPGSHVWAERYDRDLDDLFAVQDDVTERVVWALAGKVSAAEIARSRKPGKQLDSYDALLRGIEAIRRFSVSDAEAAIDHFKSSISLEPESARAHVWLAEAYANVAGFGGDSSTRGLALQAAERAIFLGDTSGHAEAIVAVVCAWRREFEKADAHLRRALALGLANIDAVTWSAYVSLWQGDHAKAIEIGKRLKRLDPLELPYFHQLLAFAYYLQGDYPAALDSFHLWNNQSHVRGFANMAACLGQLGRTEDAKKMWAKCLELRPGYSVAEYTTGSPYRRSEDLDHWVAGLRKGGIGP